MKITFNNSLADLAPKIGAPVRKDEGKIGEFKSLLRDISPFHKQDTKTTGEIAGPDEPKGVDTGPMASYRTPPPEMMMADFNRLDIDPEVGGEGVKTPTLLEAKRVRVPNAYQGLSQKDKAEEVMKLTSAFGAKYGVDPTLATAVAEAESGFDPKAISKDGHESKGLFQLLDDTGRDLLGRINKEEEYDPFNPEQNAELGISYLRYLHDLFNAEKNLPNGKATRPAADSASLEKLAVAAYNAGEGRVSSAQAAAMKDGFNPGDYYHVAPYLPETTQQYVSKVDDIRARYSGPEPELEGS